MWFTNNGQAVKVKCASKLSWSKETNLQVDTSAAGYRRAAYFGGVTVLRKMSISHDLLSPAEHGKIEALTALGMGTEFGFVPSGAELTNLLTPASSMLSRVSGYQSRLTTTTEDGTTYPGGINVGATWVNVIGYVPMPFAGQKATVSVVARNDSITNTPGSASIQYLDATGTVTGFSSINTTSPDYTRISRTATVPAGTAYMTLRVQGDVAAPAVTIGSQLYPWAVGMTAKSVVIGSGSGELISAWDKNAGAYTSADFTVQEVGDYV